MFKDLPYCCTQVGVAGVCDDRVTRIGFTRHVLLIVRSSSFKLGTTGNLINVPPSAPGIIVLFQRFQTVFTVTHDIQSASRFVDVLHSLSSRHSCDQIFRREFLLWPVRWDRIVSLYAVCFRASPLIMRIIIILLPFCFLLQLPNSSKAKQNFLIWLDQWIMFLRVNEMHRIL